MNRKFSPLFVLMAAAGAVAASAGATTASGSTPTGEAPSTNDPSAAAATKTRAPKNPDNILDIINGQIAKPLVALIRFGVANDKGEMVPFGNNNEAAKLFGTSVGKVFDIRKGRNFGYIDAGFKFTAEEIKAAKDWMTSMKTKRTEKTLVELVGAEKVKTVTDALDKMPVATAEDVAKRPATRTFGQAASTGTAPVAQTAAAPAASTAAAPAAGGGKLFGKKDA